MSLHLAQKLCVTDDFFPVVFCRNEVEFHLAICRALSPPAHLHSVIVAFAYCSSIPPRIPSLSFALPLVLVHQQPH